VASFYVGSVGTGFKHPEAREVRKLLDGMVTGRPAIAKKGKTLVFGQSLSCCRD
jgi:bifunctional non-homologous end joining protein LigD